MYSSDNWCTVWMIGLFHLLPYANQLEYSSFEVVCVIGIEASYIPVHSWDTLVINPCPSFTSDSGGN